MFEVNTFCRVVLARAPISGSAATHCGAVSASRWHQRNSLGGWYSYACRAALNMVLRTRQMGDDCRRICSPAWTFVWCFSGQRDAEKLLCLRETGVRACCGRRGGLFSRLARRDHPGDEFIPRWQAYPRWQSMPWSSVSLRIPYYLFTGNCFCGHCSGLFLTESTVAQAPIVTVCLGSTAIQHVKEKMPRELCLSHCLQSLPWRHTLY